MKNAYLAAVLLFLLPCSGKSADTTLAEAQSPTLSVLKTNLEHGDRAALDRFWQEIKGKAPLVEKSDDGFALVTFICRTNPNPASSRVLLHGGPSAHSEKTLFRLLDTDLWYRSERLPSDARFSYGYEVQTSEKSESKTIPDPLNGRLFDGRSVIELPNAAPQPWIERVPGVPEGKIATHKIQSKFLNELRDFGVYTPPNYEGQRCDLLIIFDGPAYLKLIPVPVILDNLIATGHIPPTIGIGISNPTRESRWRDLHCYQPFADFVARELIPWVHKNYKVRSNPDHVVVAGSSAGGLTAAFCAYRYPKIFGKVLSQSGSFWYAPGQEDSIPDYLHPRGWLTRQFVASPRLPLQFVLEAGRFEFDGQLSDHQRLRDVLEAKGYPVLYREYNGGHDYFNWRGTFGDNLRALIGKHTKEHQ